MKEEKYKHLNKYLKEKFGERTLKICIDGGFTCPNRDGTLSTKGCIFCSEKGSGELIRCGFGDTITEKISNQVKNYFNSYRSERANKFIAYFQNFTNTYDSLDMLKAKYAPNSEDTVEKAYKDEDGNNIKDTYQKKGGVLTNTDVNIVIESGNYFLGSGNTNIPNDCEGNVMMVGGAGNAAFQAIFKFSTNSIVHRCYNGTSWTAWRDTNTALIVSATQPTNQSPGDLWYQIVE